MKKTVVLGLLTLPIALVALCFAHPNANVPPVKKINDAKPMTSVFDVASRDKPLAIRSEKDAARYFKGDDLVKFLKQTDFDHQFALVFAWRGSGQDQMEYSVLESFPEQVVFNYKPGRTRDLRSHVQVFALRSNVKWKMNTDSASNSSEDANEYIKVKIKGKLNNQVFAIGGETTGTVISANGVTWELDLSDSAELRGNAEKLHDRVVVVSGTLQIKRGIEIQQRWIVTVDSIKNV